MTILVVDDEVVIQQMIAATVEDMGYDVLTADNGCAALEVLAHMPVPPELIISDLMMPQMNGVKLAQTLKRDQRYDAVPIVLMSAAFQSHNAPEIDHFLPKPFELSAIEGLISRYVEPVAQQPAELTMPDLTHYARDYRRVRSQ